MVAPTSDSTRTVGLFRLTTRVLLGNPLPFIPETADFKSVFPSHGDTPESPACSLRAGQWPFSAQHYLAPKSAIVLIANSRFVIPQY